MKTEVILSPLLYKGRILQEHHTTVAVDVLRATTAICAAFQSGAEEVLPLNSVDDLATYRALGYTVAAEREGKKLPYASLGNSPTEYLKLQLQGQKLAFSTTNGTVAILLGHEAERLYVGAFANLDSLAQRLTAEGRDVVVLCSGWKGEPCLEDTLFAGALVERLSAVSISSSMEMVNDAAAMAVALWRLAKADLYGYCSKATHVKRLQRLNYDCDVRLALQLNTCNVVPMMDGAIRTLRLS
ncbi:MAG: 2-phosphosulfolactate phosphatase [Bacteroidales bacterium]|nr:2-phosphosulfolactate phosphatase [Bacteroidales bacterium]